MLNIFIHAFLWLLFGVILFLNIRKIVSLSRLPVNLRWELAPLPHVKGKNKYGGSHLEDYEWWKIKRQKEVIAPLLHILKEMLFFKSVWKNNRDIWAPSWLLHFGIYFLFLTFIIDLCNTFLFENIIRSGHAFIFTLASISSLLSYIFGLVGSCYLFVKRLSDAQLKSLSNFDAYINLFLLLAIFTTGLLGWILSTGNGLTIVRSDFIRSAFSLNYFPSIPLPFLVHTCLLIIFLIYLPFSAMFHFAAKYFLYHKIRWDDSALDNRLEQEIRKQASSELRWSAGHIAKGSSQSWLNLD